MPVYNLFEKEDVVEESTQETPQKEKLISLFVARSLFALLLIGDICWLIYSLMRALLSFSVWLLTLCQAKAFWHLCKKSLLAIRRGSICALALFIAIFSPALGMMLACTYFLMYDKRGVQEVVPTSMQEHFQQFMPKE